MLAMLRDAAGLDRSDLTQQIGRIFGWNRRGNDVTSRLSAVLDELISDGVVIATEHSLALRPDER
jgi:hypothetical protein